jgi:hypothetical protein
VGCCGGVWLGVWLNDASEASITTAEMEAMVEGRMKAIEAFVLSVVVDMVARQCI